MRQLRSWARRWFWRWSSAPVTAASRYWSAGGDSGGVELSGGGGFFGGGSESSNNGRGYAAVFAEAPPGDDGGGAQPAPALLDVFAPGYDKYAVAAACQWCAAHPAAAGALGRVDVVAALGAVGFMLKRPAMIDIREDNSPIPE
jgi:hypothetical protein